jgi:hypothetical protein
MVGTAPLTRSWLEVNNINGINAWDISTMLESFIVDYLPKSIYNRRTQWAGGEFGNGFEFWRRLYIEFQGGQEAVEYGGIRRLQEFPRCTNLAKLSEHLDDWLDVLTTHGSELEHCPRLLRNMLLAIIPSDLENEIVEKSHKVEFRTYAGIIKWCRNKVEVKRTKELSEITRRPPMSTAGHIKGLGDGPTDDQLQLQQAAAEGTIPAWATEILAALRGGALPAQVPPSPAPPPPQPLEGVHALRAAAKTKPRPKTGAAKFSFKGCWHCGKDEPGHSRKTCPLFLKVLQGANPPGTPRADMKLPVDYKGAYERAREKAGLTPRKRRVAMLEDTDLDDDYSDSDDEGRLCALTTRTKASMNFETPNPFRPLQEEIDDETLEALNGWAMKVSRKSSKHAKAVVVPKPPPMANKITIQTEHELDDLLRQHPHHAAIPDIDAKIRKVLKSMPPDLVCRPGETLCLVDSGSTVNAAWIEKHFPAYAHLVKQTPASLRGDTATTACGKQLANKGRCVIRANVQGEDFTVAFKDMETDLPILSVRKMVKQDNTVNFRNGGGTITNNKTHRVVRFFEHEGVYFIKLKIDDPELMNIAGATSNRGQPPMGFHRQG